MNPTADILQELDFFRNTAVETRQQLQEESQIIRCPKKSILFRSGDQITKVYFQLTGKSFLYTMTHTGQRKIYFIFGRGQLLNQNTLQGGLSATYCEMLEESQILCIPLDCFTRCMQRDFSLTLALVKAQERKLWRLAHQMKNTVSSLYLEHKLAAKLWKLARDFGVTRPDGGIEIEIDFSVNFLADMLGVPRETASRIRNSLVRYGLISLEKKRIVVLDPDHMAHFYRTGEIVKK